MEVGRSEGRAVCAACNVMPCVLVSIQAIEIVVVMNLLIIIIIIVGCCYC